MAFNFVLSITQNMLIINVYVFTNKFTFLRNRNDELKCSLRLASSSLLDTQFREVS